MFGLFQAEIKTQTVRQGSIYQIRDSRRNLENENGALLPSGDSSRVV